LDSMTGFRGGELDENGKKAGYLFSPFGLS